MPPPLLPTLRGSGRLLPGDVVAGLTLVAIAVPEQIATARLAGLAAVAGLYAFVAGSVVFALLGRHPQLSVGADSTTAPIIASGALLVAAVGTSGYRDAVGVLALMVGGLVMATGLARLGWVADFLSTPVVTGVLGGIAVQIAVRQLPAVLGVTARGTTFLGRLGHVGGQLGHTQGWAAAVAAAVLVIIVGATRIDRRIPGALIALLVTSAAAAAGLRHHGVAVLGRVQGGLPTFSVPSTSWGDLRHLAGPALTIAFVCVVQTAATERSGQRAPDPADFDRDLLALGAASVVAGLSGSLALNASPPRTAVVTSAGGRSQLAGLVAAAVTLLVVLAATGLLDDVPEAALGAILLFVASRLFQVRDLVAVARFDLVELGLALVTLVVVALVGIEQGVAVALLMSLADRTRRAARPRDVVLGREPATDHWIPVDVGKPTEQVPGVVVYLLSAPLWYGNADYVRRRLHRLVTDSPTPVHALVLDADGVGDVDFTGAQVLARLAAELKAQHVTLVVARASHLVHRALQDRELAEGLPADRLFSSVDDAVRAQEAGPGH